MATPPPSIASALEGIELKRAEPHAFDPAVDIPAQTGKTFLSTTPSPSYSLLECFGYTQDLLTRTIVTGSTSGLGLETAIRLSKHAPRQIWLSGRNDAAGEDAVKKVTQAAGEEGKDVDIRFVKIDLADLESVRKGAKLVLKEMVEVKLDVLMLNAGIVGATHPHLGTMTPSSTPQSLT